MKYDLVKKISGLRENVASMFIDKKHTFWYILCFSVSLYVYFFLRSNLGGDLFGCKLIPETTFKRGYNE